MKHVNVISRASIGNFTGGLDAAETVVLVVLSVFFNSWDNFSSVIQNLQKYYRKT